MARYCEANSQAPRRHGPTRAWCRKPPACCVSPRSGRQRRHPGNASGREIDSWQQVRETQDAITYATLRDDVGSNRIVEQQLRGGNALVTAFTRLPGEGGLRASTGGRRAPLFESTLPTERRMPLLATLAEDRIARVGGEHPMMIPVSQLSRRVWPCPTPAPTPSSPSLPPNGRLPDATRSLRGQLNFRAAGVLRAIHRVDTGYGASRSPILP